MINSLLTLAAATGTEVAQGPISKLAGQFGVEWHLLIAQMINFCVVAFLLYRFAFKPVMKTVSLRQQKIAEGLQYAEEMKHKLADAEKEYAETLREAALEGKKIVDEAREKAKRFSEKETQEALAKASSIMKKAEEGIALEKQQMLRDLRKEVAQLVIMTTEKVLDKELSTSEQTLFSDAAVKELVAHN